MSYFGTTDYYLEIAKGNVAGHTGINKRGHDTAISTSIATIGLNNGLLYTYSTTADINTISSDNAGDTHDITVEGLDINYVPVSQTVTLNGQTPVTLGTALYRVNCMYNDFGTTGTKTLGIVYLWVSGGGATAGVPNTAADVRSTIEKTSAISNELCGNSVYTIPAGQRGFIVFGKITVTDSKALEMTFWGGIGQTAMAQNHNIDILNNNYDYFFKLPMAITEKTDIEVRCTVASGTAEVSVHFDIILVDD